MILSKKLCGFLTICTFAATVTLTAAHIFAGSTTVFCFIGRHCCASVFSECISPISLISLMGLFL